MLKAFPETKIIAAHTGKYHCRDETLIDRFIQTAKTHQNIYLDTSGVIIPKKTKDAINTISSNRIIFGTDGPTVDGARFVLEELNKIRRLKPEDEHEILGGG